MTIVRLVLTFSLILSAVNLSAMNLDQTNQIQTSDQKPSVWGMLVDRLDIDTHDLLQKILGYCLPSSRNKLVKVNKALNFLASKRNKNLLYQNPINLSDKDLRYLMMSGCVKGDFYLVENLLKNKANPNMYDCVLDKSALLCAQENKYDTIADLLQEHGATNANRTFSTEVLSPFMLALYNGDIKTIKQYLEQDANLVNATFANDMTPLHVAVYNNHYDIVELLLAYDTIEINKKDTTNCTPLHYCTLPREGDDQVHILKQLITHSAIQSNEITNYGFSPLDYAITNGFINKAKLLLTHHDMSANELYAALFYALNKNHPSIVKLLLAHSDLDVNKLYNFGTFLHLAAKYGNADSFACLLACPNVDLNAVDEHNNTPLHIAAECNNHNVIKLLLEKDGTHINAVNDLGETPLHVAAKKGSLMCVKALLAHDDIQINAQDNDNAAALHHAISSGNPEIIKLLVGCDTIQINERFHMNGQVNGTPAHLAVIMNNADILATLLECPNIRTVFGPGWDLLFHAMFNGNTKCIDVLLTHKTTQPLYQDKRSIVLHALLAAHVNSIKFLLDHNYITIADMPLVAVCVLGHIQPTKMEDIITLLIEYGVDVNEEVDIAAIKQKRTALQIVNHILHDGKIVGHNIQTNETIRVPLTETEWVVYQKVKGILILHGANA